MRPTQAVFVVESAISHTHLQEQMNRDIVELNKAGWRVVSISVVLGGGGFSAWLLGERT